MTMTCPRVRIASARLPLALLGLCAAGACAAEFAARDAVLAIEALPTGFTYSADGGSGSSSGTDGFDSGTGLRAGARRSWTQPASSWGAIYGADLLAEGFSYGGGGMSSYGLRLAGGAGWALDDRWQIDGEAGLAGGIATLDLEGTASAPALTGDGRWYGLDVRAGAGWQATRAIQVRIQIGYQMASYAFSGSEIDLDLTRSGVSIGIGAAWRISDAPTVLE